MIADMGLLLENLPVLPFSLTQKMAGVSPPPPNSTKRCAIKSEERQKWQVKQPEAKERSAFKWHVWCSRQATVQ